MAPGYSPGIRRRKDAEINGTLDPVYLRSGRCGRVVLSVYTDDANKERRHSINATQDSSSA